MGIAIGIDLGTTNSVAAVVRNNEAKVVKDAAGRHIQPSIVSFLSDGDVLSGHQARDRQVVDSKNTIYSFKRLLGQDLNTPEMGSLIDTLPYEVYVRPEDEIPVVRVRDFHEISLPEVCAVMLRHLKKTAEQRLGTIINEAVITVPANFNDVQRSFTKLAARIAGLNVLRILNEPTAAALAYGFGGQLTERIAVYDFGGGTFDITIVELSDDIYEVLSTAGDNRLGGDDFDSIIVNKMRDQLMSTHKFDLAEDPMAIQRIRFVAEKIKCQLSSLEDVQATLQDIATLPDGKSIDFHFKMTRTEFETLATPLIEKSLAVCDEALKLAKMDRSSLDNLVFVGGTTRIPLIRSRTTEYFGIEPRTEINPDEVVAIGAAVQAFSLTGQQITGLDIESSDAPADLPMVAPSKPSVGEIELDFEDAELIDDPADLIDDPAEFGESEIGEDEIDLAEVDVLANINSLSPGAVVLDLDDAEFMAEELSKNEGAPKSLPPSSSLPGSSSLPPPLQGMLNTDQIPSAKGRISSTAYHEAITSPTGSNAPPPPPKEPPAKELPAKPAVGIFPVKPVGEPIPHRSAPMAQPTPIAEAQSSPAASPEAQDPKPVTPIEKLFDDGISDEEVGIELEMDSPEEPETNFLDGAPVEEAEESWLPLEIQETRSVHPGDVVQAGQKSKSSAIKVPPQAAEIPFALPVVPEAKPALLLDVTPRAFGVATAGGFCDPIIERNAAIPVEQSRLFSTSTDNQTEVSINIFQGESRRVDGNTELGKVVLSDLRPAPRGEIKIRVTFEIDTDGILGVSAKNEETGQAQSTRIVLSGSLDDDQVDALMEKYADND